MEVGLHPGRLGACALVLAALLALTQAVESCQASARVPLVASRSAPLPGAVAARRGWDQPILRTQAVVLPSLAPALTAMIPPGRPVVRVPILMYHYIRVNPNPGDRVGFRLSVTPADFEAQVTWLAANGYHAVDLQDLERYLAGARSLPSRPVVLTFDDGYR